MKKRIISLAIALLLVCGIADSSELINFTIQLLRRRYSHADIEKIWGGNWLRVMAEVQKSRIQ